MATDKLTDAALRKVKPTDKAYKLYDGGGLHLLVLPDGKRYWRLDYRFGGKQRTLACGVYPDVSLTVARAKREAARADLSADPPRDPVHAKQQRAKAAAEAAGDTFDVMARKWWEAKCRPSCTPAYADQVMRRLEADVLPVIGKQPIGSIEPVDLVDMLDRAQKRGGHVRHETLRRLHETVGRIFRFALAAPKSAVTRDPTRDVKLREVLEARPQEERHHKAMPREDLPEFLRKLDDYDGELQTQLAVRLIVLTILRTDELRGGRWDEIEQLDGSNPQWRVPAARMKRPREHIVPLSRQAVSVLHELKKLAGDSPFLFPSPSIEGYMSNNTMLYALYRMGYHGRATIHGFRAVASTVLNESNEFKPDWIEMQLAHVEQNKVRSAYLRAHPAQWLPERRKMMQWYANYLNKAKQGIGVVPMEAAE